MDENNDIEKRIKDSFDGLNKSAPDNLWNRLSGKLSGSDIDKSIDAKIKDGFENISKSAPTHIWNSVNHQLNIDRVWKRISAELDRRPVFHWKRIAGIAVLLVLLFVGGFYLFNNSNTPFIPDTGHLNEQEQKSTEEFQQLAAVSDKGYSKGENSVHRSGTAKTFNEETYPTQQSGLTSEKDGTIPMVSDKNHGFTNYESEQPNNVSVNTTGRPVSNILYGDSMSLFTMIPVKTIFIKNSIASDSIRILSCITQPIIPADTTSRKKKQFEIGVIYSYNNTWLINNDTRKSFDENSLIQTVPTFAGSYGIVANYNILSNSSVSAEFFVNSKYIQRYDEFVEGVFNNRRTQFNYYKLAFLYQFSISQSPYKAVPSKYIFRAGFYGSYLKNHTHEYTRVMNRETNAYTKFDYGARIAIGQEKIFRSIIIGYGLNAEYGFKNIFEGSLQVPSRFDVSRNALIGGYLNLKYRF